MIKYYQVDIGHLTVVGIDMGVSKNRGKLPKMHGENNGSNPMNKWMIWGVFPFFLETPI